MRLAVAALVGAASLLAGCSGAETGDAPGTTVTVFGPWRDVAADRFREAVAPFEERTGVDVVYTGTGSFAADVARRLEDGLAPDVIMFPQPGLMLDLLGDGYLVPLREDVVDTARASHRPALASAAQSLTAEAGVLYRLNVKSLVWYAPAAFESAGYDVPDTWSELTALVDRVQAEGTSPWCLGVEAFGASGWPATDWIEDLLLRSVTPAEYDAWTTGDLPFTAPSVRDAFVDFEALTLSPGRSFGGRRGVLNTSALGAQQPMFTDPPGCLLYRQASFAADSLPDGARIGPDSDTDVFVLPSRTNDPPPLLVGGTFAAAGTDRAATWQLLDYLASPDGSATWVESGGFVSPHRSVSEADYGDSFDARVAGLLSDAEVVRFDGSDLMPPEVGSRSFFDAMLTFIATSGVDDSLALAQSGWDKVD